MVRLVLAALLLALLAAAPPAGAQNFPDRPIRIIVPLAPGGGTDVFARLLAELASPALGQPIVIENRTGAVGTIGMQALAQAAPDGHTLGFTVNSPLTSAHHAVTVRYTLDQFEPMFIAARGPFTAWRAPCTSRPSGCSVVWTSG
jgi:tripartite-type tricarboxylate transporter receptor subunit TctC